MLTTVALRCAQGLAVGLLSTAAVAATGAPVGAAESGNIGTGVSAERPATVRTAATSDGASDLTAAQEYYDNRQAKVANKQKAADKAATKAVEAEHAAKAAAKKAAKKGASSSTKKAAKKAADKARDALGDYERAAKELATAKQEAAAAAEALAAAQRGSRGAGTPSQPGAVAPAPSGATPSGATPSGSAPSGSSTLDRNRASILDQANRARSQAGCGPLRYNTTLERSAQPYAEDMSKYRYMSHVSRTGESFDARIWGTGYDGKRIGENLGEGFSSPTSVFTAWMNSPSHRANILNCKFTQLGVGFAAAGGYWVQHFGG